jgi:hypothetical protein
VETNARFRHGVTAAEYAQNLEANLSDHLERIKSGRYQAPPVRRVYIPRAVEPDLFGHSAFQPSIALSGGWRAIVSVPMLRDGQPIGAIAIAKVDPGARWPPAP